MYWIELDILRENFTSRIPQFLTSSFLPIAVNVPLEVCWSFFAFHLVFSAFFLAWSVLVAVVLVSVARTHTIEIRRFMCELSLDAQIHDRKFRHNYNDSAAAAAATFAFGDGRPKSEKRIICAQKVNERGFLLSRLV